MTSSGLEWDYYEFEPVETSYLEYATPGANSLLLPTWGRSWQPAPESQCHLWLVNEQPHVPLRNSPRSCGHSRRHKRKRKIRKAREERPGRTPEDQREKPRSATALHTCLVFSLLAARCPWAEEDSTLTSLGSCHELGFGTPNCFPPCRREK